jgi:hypothetical protein
MSNRCSARPWSIPTRVGAAIPLRPARAKVANARAGLCFLVHGAIIGTCGESAFHKCRRYCQIERFDALRVEKQYDTVLCRAHLDATVTTGFKRPLLRKSNRGTSPVSRCVRPTDTAVINAMR